MKLTKISLACLAALGLTMMSNPTLAQSANCDIDRDVGTKALDEATWKQLNNVYEDVGEERYDEAFATLQKMSNRAGRDEYLQAVLAQALAQVEWSRENFDSALGHFENAIELDALPNQAHFSLMYQVSQLYFMKERYDDALERLDMWFCTVPAEEVDSDAYVLKASIYASKKNYQEVLKAIDTAISLSDEPKESWYQLKLASHFELEQIPQAGDTLEIMIQNWPDKKMYWTQLSQVYLKQKQDEKALSVMALAYRRGMLDKQADITYLSNLYSNSDVPYKAAEVLENGIKAGVVEPTKNYWTSIADSWYAAEELDKSLAAYKEAGKVASDGNIDLRRGYILIDMEIWDEARDAMTDALEKGGLNDRKTGEAYLLRGMAQFSLGDWDKASSDWGKASRYEKTRASARQWMAHMAEERKRRAP